MKSDRLDRERLVEAAIARAGHDELGEPTWQEGLDILLGSLVHEANLHDLGVEVAAHDIENHLANRAAILAWREQHPEIASGSIRLFPPETSGVDRTCRPLSSRLGRTTN